MHTTSFLQKYHLFSAFLLGILVVAGGTSASEPMGPGVLQAGENAVQTVGPYDSLTASGVAQAQAPDEPVHGEEEQPAAPKQSCIFTGNLAVTSNYVFRGLTQTDGKPAIQGEFDLALGNGFYLGTWLSNVSWYTDQNAAIASAPVALASPGSVGAPYNPFRSNSAHLEWDFYGGYKNTFATDWSYDLGIIEYYYPGVYDNLGAYRRPDTTEIYAALGYKWISFKFSKAISAYTFGVNESKGASYIDLSALVPIRDTGFKVLVHVGRQEYPASANRGYWGMSGGDNSYFSYSDTKLGLTLDRWGCTFGAAYTYADTRDTAPDDECTAYRNAFGRNIGRGQVAVTIMKSF